jgi:hypothetical protein
MQALCDTFPWNKGKEEIYTGLLKPYILYKSTLYTLIKNATFAAIFKKQIWQVTEHSQWLNLMRLQQGTQVQLLTRL